MGAAATNIQDTVRMHKIDKKVDFYEKKYGKHFRTYERSLVAKAKNGGLQLYDYYQLGKQLEQVEEQIQSVKEEQGNVNLLGVIPNIAFDVITAVQGASVLPVIASTQPIDEERGTVYFKQIRSATTRGSQTAGNVVVDPRTNIVTPQGYSDNRFEDVNVATTVALQVLYTFTLPAYPVKSESLSLFLSSNTAIAAKDIGVLPGGPSGVGNIYGNGVSGSINYLTGVVTLVFAADPGAANNIVATWQQNYELSTDIPQIDTFFDSKGILAEVFALKQTMGMFQSYGMNKRFGMSAEDEAAKDLVQEINREIAGKGIRKLRTAANAFTTTQWPQTAPAGVSYFEHKQTYVDYLAKAEAQMISQAGRGKITVLIVGKDHAAVLQTMPGFQLLSDGTTLGSHIFGTFHGITVIRVVEAGLLPSGLSGVGIWKGMSPFEAALVYSPYMPLTVTSVLPQAPNPLQSMRAAAVWAGLDTLVPQYAVNFDIV